MSDDPDTPEPGAGDTGPAQVAAQSSAEVRERIVAALELDLVGPHPDHPWATECLSRRDRPSNVYLTGFLIPRGTASEHAGDADEQDDFAEVEPGLAEESSSEERRAAKRSYYPSSMGLSALVPEGLSELVIELTWGDYRPDMEPGRDGTPMRVWRRTPGAASLTVGLPGDDTPAVHPVAGSRGLEVHVLSRAIGESAMTVGIPAGTRSVSVFLVNGRRPVDEPRAEADRAYVFQPVLTVRTETPEAFVPRPDLRGALGGRSWDECVADLHYADSPEFASGHGVSAGWTTDGADGHCREIHTCWIPRAGVERTRTHEVPGLMRGMSELGELSDGTAARGALSPLVEQYKVWIAEGRGKLDALRGDRRETAELLLQKAETAAQRIEAGLKTLEEDPLALEAFRVANRSVGAALTRRLKLTADKPAQWRAFQLAFILLNLRGMADPTDPHRKTVDLLFFPTGGGKTEAYLGLAAFAMVYRRLKNPEAGATAGAGVSVVMRYTLRLLTLDQLGRAAGLVCALELERMRQPEQYGTWPFEIGLWVGQAATPNRLGSKGDSGYRTARAMVKAYQRHPDYKPRPIPLEKCPWCGCDLTPDSFELRPNADQPERLSISCRDPDLECEFSDTHPLPIVAVDEEIYRRLPAFLISTVDKFAALPWTGPSGKLLGGAVRCDAGGFYGAAEPGAGTKMSAALPPPDLIIQDELHLISGPLGTVMGLYETVIEGLCVRDQTEPNPVRPKIVASTATARQAGEQVQALFGRGRTHIFPPPGPSRRDSFFAQTPAEDGENPARHYIGVTASGRNAKEVLRRTWLALMGAAQHQWVLAGGHERRDGRDNPADPYMTALGYFNSLRELGGARRVLEEQVHNTLQSIGMPRRANSGLRIFRDRRSKAEVVELTSRVRTADVAEARDRLEATHHEDRRVDYAIATNMISVGLDVPRLGVMLVMGQPKTHSEYIQATSRVGRDLERPGLVIAVLNVNKPRDRSHYESFGHYHRTFYRGVESASVTPFSARAMDRAFGGAVVGFARHAMSSLTPAAGVETIRDVREPLGEWITKLFLERLDAQKIDDDTEREAAAASIRGRVGQVLDAWVKRVHEIKYESGGSVRYQKFEPRKHTHATLLREMLDTELPEIEALFRTNRSLRDVEPEVAVFVKEP